MTLDTKVKAELRYRHPNAFTFKRPKDGFTVLSVDFMQFLKSIIPDWVKTQADLVTYFVRKIMGLFDYANVVIVCVDKKGPIGLVKKLVCKRHDRRCKPCQQMGPLPMDTSAPASLFSPKCEKQCFENQILHSSEGPHLPSDNETKLDFGWSRFCSDSGNLRNELYPRMVNALLSIQLPAQKRLEINGFPIKLQEVQEWSPDSTLVRWGAYERRVIVTTWTYADLPLKQDDNIFGHTLCIEGNNKWVDNDKFNMIVEADNTIFYMLQFYPDHYRHAVYINDGDAISIGLFLAHEYAMGPNKDGNPVYTHELWLMMPNKAKKLNPPPFEYISLTELHHSIQNMPEFQKAGVQCPIATVVFLIILSGTDFFQGFCNGIGLITDWNTDEDKRAKQTYNIWDTFYSKLDMFSHLVQYYRGTRDVKVERRIVLDEKLFLLFEQHCYINKYGNTVSKKKRKVQDKDVSFDEIRVHCGKNLKDAARHPPSDEIMLRQCRQIAFQANYWLNEPRGVHLDPFEEYNGLPYFGYKREPSPHIVHIVATKQKPVDETYKRHFWKRKQKQQPVVNITEKRKALAMDIIKGK